MRTILHDIDHDPLPPLPLSAAVLTAPHNGDDDGDDDLHVSRALGHNHHHHPHDHHNPNNNNEHASHHDWPSAYQLDLPYAIPILFDDPTGLDPAHPFGPLPHQSHYASFALRDVSIPSDPQDPSLTMNNNHPASATLALSPQDPEEGSQQHESPDPQAVGPSPGAAIPLEATLTKKSTPPAVDPYAAGFLREVLGEAKWTIFSARLFERRLAGPRRSKKNERAAPATAKTETTATLIDFLCKAEAVKEVLRNYVPHPYNPHKTLAHPYSRAPTGRVTLSRSTVLALSGWSNTQFSYWARRSEAVGVLAYHDRRLKSVAIAFHARLNGSKIADEVAATEGITGKGLDAIVDEVKERTGASPFIRGKHSCLDSFTLADSTLAEAGTGTGPANVGGVGVLHGDPIGQQWMASVVGPPPFGAGMASALYGYDGTDAAMGTGGVPPQATSMTYFMPGPLEYQAGPHFQVTGPDHYAAAAAAAAAAVAGVGGELQSHTNTGRASKPKRTRKKAPAVPAKNVAGIEEEEDGREGVAIDLNDGVDLKEGILVDDDETKLREDEDETIVIAAPRSSRKRKLPAQGEAGGPTKKRAR